MLSIAHFQIAKSITLDRRQSKTSVILTNIDQKSLETEFLIAICQPKGDKWQSKTLFLAIFDQYSLIVKSVFNCRISGVSMAPTVFSNGSSRLQSDQSLC